MSADNWATCPRCLARATAAKDEAKRKADAAYGVVPPEEFDALRELANRSVASFAPTEDGVDGLAEYYSFDIGEDGTFDAYYNASCRTCGFGHNFKHSEKLTIEAQS